MNFEDKNLNIDYLKDNNIFLKQIKKIKYFLFCSLILIIFLFIINLIINLIFKNNIIIKQKNDIKKLNNILSSNINNKYIDNIYDKIKLLKLITNNNIFEYEGVKNCLLNDPDNKYCIYHLISPKKVIGKKRILIGDKKDGSYILLDDFKDIKIAYSFGISNKIEFDKALADRGIDIYMYDHTINKLPYYNSKFHWQKIGITGNNQTNDKLKTLEELIFINGHNLEKNMILKIDVEHSEWNSLNNLPDNILNQFKYILIEYHFYKKNYIKLYYNVLKKLQKNHQVFYIRCNGRHKIITFGNNRICKYLEVSYVIKDDNQFTIDDSIYPIFEFDFTPPRLNKKTEMNLNILKLFDN